MASLALGIEAFSDSSRTFKGSLCKVDGLCWKTGQRWYYRTAGVPANMLDTQSLWEYCDDSQLTQISSALRSGFVNTVAMMLLLALVGENVLPRPSPSNRGNAASTCNTSSYFTPLCYGCLCISPLSASFHAISCATYTLPSRSFFRSRSSPKRYLQRADTVLRVAARIALLELDLVARLRTRRPRHCRPLGAHRYDANYQRFRCIDITRHSSRQVLQMKGLNAR